MAENKKDTAGSVSRDLNANRSFIEETFSVSENFDFIVREFDVKFDDGEVPGFLVFYDGLVDQTYINRDIMRG